MTAYGESIAQEENSFDSYLVIPGSLQQAEANERINKTISYDWDLDGPRRYLLQFNEFHLNHYRSTKANLAESKFTASEDFVLMQFCIDGDCSYLNDNYKKGVSFTSLEHNILYIPATEEYIFSSNSETLEIVNIYLDRNLLLKYIPDDHKLTNKIHNSSWGNIIENNMIIGPKMQSVLHDILNCEFSGHLKELYTRAKIIELLTLQLAQQEKEDHGNVGLKQTDIDKMLLVKNIITTNFQESFSLSYLAKKVGTNEQYLKKHFKMLFGATVLNYIITCKMEKAKELLLQGEHKITDIAQTVGYKHATHFTAAFKKFFGYLPKDIRVKIKAFFIATEFLKDIEIMAVF